MSTIYTMPEGKTEVRAICDAPAGTCGNGRRRRVLTKTMTCALCGSQMRLAKKQHVSKPGLTKNQRRALASIAKATDAAPPLCYAICPTKECRRKDVEALRAAGLIRHFDSGLSFQRGVSTMVITDAGRTKLREDAS